MNRRLGIRMTASLVLGLAAVATTSAAAAGTAVPSTGAIRAAARVAGTTDAAFPTTIPLPDGFQPEGIAIGRAPVAYFGSLVDGSIYQASLATGEGSVISQGPGTPSVGLKVDDRGRLFVAGGAAGDARVVDTRTGQILASYQFATGDTFINDVVLTPDAAWFTDSRVQALYKLPLGGGGALPSQDDVVTLPLTGDLVFTDGFNANGIVRTPDGSGLIVVQSNTGGLFRVDPATGATTAVDLAGDSLPNGDGLLLQGSTLFAVQNQDNTVAAIRLDQSGTAGTVFARVTDPRLDVPTTVAAFGDRLYLPNARFNTTPEPTTPYSAIAIPRPEGPTTIPLPDGFQPEGIATGPGPFAYFGSRVDGSIYRADLTTGEGETISQGPGTPSLGLKTDRSGRLFVAGGSGGDGRVVDTRTGEVLASYQFASGDTFVNDVVLTPDAAWFTDSRVAALYKVPLGRNGRLPTQEQVVTLPLTGDLVFGEGNNSNGIVRTPDGRGLIVVQSNTGGLFRVDPATGVTTAVDLAGESLPNGDGLLLQGSTLFAVQNRLNTVAVLTLNRTGTAGTVVTRVTDPAFDVPTTVAAFGDWLYLPNARFTTTPEPTTPYSAVAIPRPSAS